MKFRITQKIPNVYVITFDKRYELCMSLLRIQEFYESPKYKSKYFTLEEFVDYWSDEFGNGLFDYPAKWNGFNFLGQTLLDWLFLFPYQNGSYRSREREVIDRLIKRIAKDNGIRWPAKRHHPDYWGCLSYEDLEKCLKNVYIIAVNNEDGGKTQAVNHELAHAVYTLHPSYKKSCTKLLIKMGHNTHNTRSKLIRERSEDKLAKMGYCKDVMEDELQAYYSTGGIGDDVPDISEFKNNYKNFLKKLKNA